MTERSPRSSGLEPKRAAVETLEPANLENRTFLLTRFATKNIDNQKDDDCANGSAERELFLTVFSDNVYLALYISKFCLNVSGCYSSRLGHDFLSAESYQGLDNLDE